MPVVHLLVQNIILMFLNTWYVNRLHFLTQRCIHLESIQNPSLLFQTLPKYLAKVAISCVSNEVHVYPSVMLSIGPLGASTFPTVPNGVVLQWLVGGRWRGRSMHVSGGLDKEEDRVLGSFWLSQPLPLIFSSSSFSPLLFSFILRDRSILRSSTHLSQDGFYQSGSYPIILPRETHTQKNRGTIFSGPLRGEIASEDNVGAVKPQLPFYCTEYIAK